MSVADAIPRTASTNISLVVSQPADCIAGKILGECIQPPFRSKHPNYRRSVHISKARCVLLGTDKQIWPFVYDSRFSIARSVTVEVIKNFLERTVLA